MLQSKQLTYKYPLTRLGVFLGSLGLGLRASLEPRRRVAVQTWLIQCIHQALCAHLAALDVDSHPRLHVQY